MVDGQADDDVVAIEDAPVRSVNQKRSGRVQPTRCCSSLKNAPRSGPRHHGRAAACGDGHGRVVEAVVGHPVVRVESPGRGRQVPAAEFGGHPRLRFGVVAYGQAPRRFREPAGHCRSAHAG